MGRGREKAGNYLVLKKQHFFFNWLAFNWMIFTKSLHGKWLESTKDPSRNGCFGDFWSMGTGSFDLQNPRFSTAFQKQNKYV